MVIRRECPITKRHLTQCILTTWANITADMIDGLYESPPIRVRAGVRMHGNPTRY